MKHGSKYDEHHQACMEMMASYAEVKSAANMLSRAADYLILQHPSFPAE